MAEATDKVVETLNGLIETCKDSANGFGAAANAVANVELKTLFQSYSQQRAGFVTQLQEQVRHRGADPEKMGTVAGTLHRGWMSLKSIVPGRGDLALVTECLRGEEAARGNYEGALQQSLPDEVRALLERQRTSVSEAVERLRALEKVLGEKS